MEQQVTRLSDTRWKVKRGHQTYYVKMVEQGSEDYDPWNRTGTPTRWDVDDGSGPRRVETGYKGAPDPTWAVNMHQSTDPSTPVVVANGTLNPARFFASNATRPAMALPGTPGTQQVAYGPNPNDDPKDPTGPVSFRSVVNDAARRYVYAQAEEFAQANAKRMALDPVIVEALKRANQ